MKTFTKQKHVPSDQFGAVVKNVGVLISNLYSFISRSDDGGGGDDEEKPKSKKEQNKAVARAKKDERIQPALIFEIEHLETSLIKYQKQCKMSFMINWTRSVERGYQVRAEKKKEKNPHRGQRWT